MTEAKEALYVSRLTQLLRHARGRRNAITLDRMVKICGLPNRRVAEHLLEHHLEDLGFCVVSGDKGYWRPITADEVNHYQNSLQSRLRKLAKRKSSVRRMAARDGFIRDGKQFQDPPAIQGDLFDNRDTGIPACAHQPKHKTTGATP